MNPITEVRVTRQDTRSPSAAPNWLTDWRADHFHKQQCNSNSTQRVCFLATGERWYYSRVVRDGLLPSQQYQRNNTCITVHKHWWCERKSISIWSLTLSTHVPLDLVGVKLSKALHMDTALALGLERRIAEPSSAVNNRHHLFLSIRDRGRNECC